MERLVCPISKCVPCRALDTMAGSDYIDFVVEHYWCDYIVLGVTW
jgi:hypothetical protein